MIWQNKPTQNSTNVERGLTTVSHRFSFLRKETDNKIQDCNLLLELLKKIKKHFFLYQLHVFDQSSSYIYISYSYAIARLRDFIKLNYSSPYGYYGAITWAVLETML